MKKFMVVEKFKPGLFEENNKRWNEKGRMLPEGLYYLNSWVNKEQNICFQLMETNNPDLFEEWIENWKDFTDFEVYPID
ncbi:DUF3303 domain-containing protein [Marinigracilibium pacificum]|uniref:DUF3303 family protein n=1 Tax=Marinigracilibium pacificum TaxID=2729599 RepID=A0A848IZD1_9BACT|nr:DUF3303 family protein [Marinigracilibium pacificum]NMM47650.1 DUF3303 family protein [Marinigracilibium pacificum]